MSGSIREVTPTRPRSVMQIDHRIRLVTPGNWIMISGSALVIAAALIWGVFGSIPTEVTGQGVLVTAAEDVDAIETTATGVVRGVMVTVGDTIQAHRPILRLDQPELEAQVGHASERLEELRTLLARTRAEVAAERAEQRQRTDAQLASLDLGVRQAQGRSARLGDILASLEMLLSRGNARRLDVEQLRQSRDQANAEILRGQADMQKAEGAFLEVNNQLNVRVADATHLVADQKAKYDELRDKLALWQFVRAPSSGHVEEIRVSVGTVVRPGDVLVIVAKENSGHDVLAFLEPYNGKLVKPGMPVHVVPATIKKEEFGSMRGTVTLVSERSLSEAAIEAMLHDETLSRSFVKNGAPIFARIHLDEVPDSPNGFTWWAGHGPSFPIETGTLSAVEVVVRSQPPITTIIPFLNKAFGL